MDWLAGELGEYPFSQTGGLVTSLSPGFALENQTRPTYPALNRGATSLLVHELAHQWFGDSVAVHRWRDIWLNEGFATFMQVRYDETHGGPDAQAWLEDQWRGIGEGTFWELPIDDPGAPDIFAPQVYTRGAMTLQALRHRVGEADFWTILRTWAHDRAGGNGSTEEFRALAEHVSGQDLDGVVRRLALDRHPARPHRRQRVLSAARAEPARAGIRRLSRSRCPGRLPSLRRRASAPSGRPSPGAAPSRSSGR